MRSRATGGKSVSTEDAQVSLRPAAPTFDEGRAFARLVDQAQEGYFRAMFGRRAGDVIARAFTRPSHELSHHYVTFAEQGGRIVGMASGYTSEEHQHFTDGPLRSAAGRRRLRMAVFTRITRRMVRFMGAVPDGDFYVRAVAVEPAHRGAGIGTLLIGSLEGTARAAGSVRLALDVAAKNRDARRLYERLGMIAEAESRKWFGLPNTNLIRMTKPLCPSA